MNSPTRQRGRVAVVLGMLLSVFGLAALAGGLAGSASAAPTTGAIATPVAAPVLSTTERGLCIKQGTGEPRSLWLVAATHRCPAPFWGPTTLEVAFGKDALPVAGPAVDSRIVITSGKVDVAAGSVDKADGTARTVTVTGMPKYSETQARRVLVDVDGESLPTAVNATATLGSITPGSTTWTWTVTTKGGTASTTAYTLKLDVLAIPVG
jgi:hypothetical protein